MPGFVLDLTDLPSGASRALEEAGAKQLDLPEGQWPGRVRGTLELEKTGERVHVRGTVEAVARLECVRCLNDFEQPLRMPLGVLAERSGTSSRREEEDLERDAYMVFHDGRKLDLRATVREGLLLEIPIAPRCREDCAGLCPRCGADLNAGPHACRSGPA